MKAKLPFVNVLIWTLISKQSLSPLAKYLMPLMITARRHSLPASIHSSNISQDTFVAPLVLLRRAAWWPDCGADYRWQGHCWPEGPGNVGMAMWKGHHRSTVSIITVTQWGESCRKQQADWRTFTRLGFSFKSIFSHIHIMTNLVPMCKGRFTSSSGEKNDDKNVLPLH